MAEVKQAFAEALGWARFRLRGGHWWKAKQLGLGHVWGKEFWAQNSVLSDLHEAPAMSFQMFQLASSV